MIDTLDDKGYWYLGQEYTKFPTGLEVAFVMARRISGALMQNGHLVFSPITHSHPIVPFAGSADTRENWMALNKIMLLNSVGLLIIRTKNWFTSEGLVQELRWAIEHGLAVFFLNPVSLKFEHPTREELTILDA